MLIEELLPPTSNSWTLLFSTGFLPGEAEPFLIPGLEVTLFLFFSDKLFFTLSTDARVIVPAPKFLLIINLGFISYTCTPILFVSHNF